MTAIYWPDFATSSHSPEGSSSQHVGLIFQLYALPFDVRNKGVPLELSGSFWYGKTMMAGLQSGEGQMMIDQVV